MAESRSESPPQKRRRLRRAAVSAHESPAVVIVGRAPPVVRTGGPVFPVLAMAAVCAALASDAVPRFVLGVIALALGFVALAAGKQRIQILQVELDPTSPAVRIVSNQGEDVALPIGGVARFEGVRRTYTSSNRAAPSGSRTRVGSCLLIHKADGGVLDTVSFPEEDAAQAAARDLDAALHEARSRPAPGPPADPLATLGRMPAFTVTSATQVDGGYRNEPGGEVLEIGWSGQGLWHRYLAGLALVCGMGIVFHGFGRAPDGDVERVGSYVMGAMALVVLVGFASTVGTRIVVRVDQETVSFERRRFSRPSSRKAWPVGTVRAIDLSLSASSTALVVRAGEARTIHDAANPGASVVDLASALLAHGRNEIPLGSLTLAEAVQLDLALSEAVARHTDVEPGSV